MLPIVTSVYASLTCGIKLESPIVILFVFKRCKRDELEIAVSSVSEDVYVIQLSVFDTDRPNVGTENPLVTVWLGSDAIA